MCTTQYCHPATHCVPHNTVTLPHTVYHTVPSPCHTLCTAHHHHHVIHCATNSTATLPHTVYHTVPSNCHTLCTTQSLRPATHHAPPRSVKPLHTSASSCHPSVCRHSAVDAVKCSANTCACCVNKAGLVLPAHFMTLGETQRQAVRVQASPQFYPSVHTNFYPVRMLS